MGTASATRVIVERRFLKIISKSKFIIWMPQQLPALLFAFLPNDSHYLWVIVRVIVGARQQLPAHRFPFPANVSHTMRVIVGVIVGKHSAGAHAAGVRRSRVGGRVSGRPTRH